MTPKWQNLGDDYPGVRVQVARVGGRLRIVGIQVQNAEGVTHDAIRSVPVVQLEAKLNRPEKRDAVATPASVGVRMVLPESGWPPPKRHELYLRKEYFEKEGRGYSPELYARIAMLYTRCVAGGVRPAPAIAEANDVPVSTVHGWIQEARRRGALAPARTKGAAG